jgi:hypothetical protein
MKNPSLMRVYLPLLSAGALAAPSAMALLKSEDATAFAAVAGLVAVITHVLLYAFLFASVAYAVFKVPGRWPQHVKLLVFIGVGVATFAVAMLLTLLPYLMGALICYGAKVCDLSLFAEQLTNALFIVGLHITRVYGLVVCLVVVAGFVLLRRRFQHGVMRAL